MLKEQDPAAVVQACLSGPAETSSWAICRMGGLQACPGFTLTGDKYARLAFFLCSLVMPFQLLSSPLIGSVWPPFEAVCTCLKPACLFHFKTGSFHCYFCQGPASSFGSQLGNDWHIALKTTFWSADVPKPRERLRHGPVFICVCWFFSSLMVVLLTSLTVCVHCVYIDL